MTSNGEKESRDDVKVPATKGFSPHDHTACVSDALAAADQLCKKNGLRFTPVRRRVLEILLEEHRALGAYTVLEQLSEDGFGAQPPVAYRALDFLVLNGFAHKIERLNAFIACAHPGHDHAPAFMICRLCDAVAETAASSTKGRLEKDAQATGFRIERTLVEAEGVCPACVSKDNA
jgi:Fur family zinc uptake transcriptional regulator